MRRPNAGRVVSQTSRRPDLGGLRRATPSSVSLVFMLWCSWGNERGNRNMIKRRYATFKRILFGGRKTGGIGWGLGYVAFSAVTPRFLPPEQEVVGSSPAVRTTSSADTADISGASLFPGRYYLVREQAARVAVRSIREWASRRPSSTASRHSRLTGRMGGLGACRGAAVGAAIGSCRVRPVTSPLR